MVDHILYNARVITLDERAAGRAEAIAITGNRIIAVGSNEHVLGLREDHTTQEDLRGACVLPGLVDAHVHLEWTARALQSIDLFEVASKEEALRRIAERVATVASPDEWVIGRGWSQDLWEGRAFPSADDLEASAPQNPVYFPAKSGHAAWVNRAAMRTVGINAATPNPPGGEIVRDESGEPTGILLETAMHLVRAHIPEPDIETLATYLLQAQAQMLQSGLTGVHDFDDPQVLRALQLLRERGELRMRVLKQINRPYLQAAIQSGLRSGFGDDWLRIGNLKMFADGALGPRTAHMVEPYLDQPENRGMAVLTPEEMLESAIAATDAGLATTIHAIGDLAVRQVLDVFKAVRQHEMARGIRRSERRHRIEHVQIIHPNDAHRLGQLDIIASMQPIHATSDWEAATLAWGEQRCKTAYNPKLQLENGARIAFGSDSPIEPFAPLLGIHAAVTRQRRDNTPQGGWYPDLRLSLDETLHGFTTGPAYAALMEDRLGRLAVGYLADLTVLDDDPYTVAPADLWQIPVQRVMTDGVWR